MSTTTPANKTTWSKRAVKSIATEMMKSGRQGVGAARMPEGVSEEERDLFVEKYRDLIEEFLPLIPRGMSAVGAAVCKCAIKFGKERPTLFLQNVKDGMFQGRNDPVHLFWRWINKQGRGVPKRARMDQQTSYIVTLKACKAFCEYRELKDGVAALSPPDPPDGFKDVFTWDENWNYRS